MLVYMSLLAIVSIVVINNILGIGKLFWQAKEVRNVQEAAHAALERIVREIRFADRVVVGSSVLGSNPGTLVLSSIDPVTEASQTITIRRSGNEITLQKDSGSAEPLSPTNVVVDNLIFRHIATTSPEAIKIEMSTEGKNFYATTILRRSY